MGVVGEITGADGGMSEAKSVIAGTAAAVSAETTASTTSAVEILMPWAEGLRARTGAAECFVLLGPSNTGPFEFAATAPADRSPGRGVTAAVDHAVAQRKPIVKSGFLEGGVTSCAVGVPLIERDALHGAVVLRLAVSADLDLRRVVDEVNWALPALRAQLLRDALDKSESGQSRARLAVELLAAALEEPRWRVAASVAVTGMADRLGADRVSLGRRRRRRSRIAVMSHSAGFSRKAELVQRIADAMDEAIDQGRRILYPEDGDRPLTVTAAHAALTALGAERAVVTVPLRRGDRITGAITAERPAAQPFDPRTVELIEVAADILGPVLEEKRLNDRPFVVKGISALGSGVVSVFGPTRVGLKLGLLAAALAVFAALTVTASYRVTADARVEGSVRRVVAAPLDGYVASAAVQPGDTVREGEVMATMDDRDVALELKRWETVRAQRQREYETALGERDPARIGIAATQIGQADAEIALLQERLARTRLVAPFDGIVLSGDLDQSVGAPVSRGTVLYEIAPLDTYRIVLSVDERDLADMSPGLPGEVVLTALPGRSFAVETGRVTSVAGVEDGRNVFRVNAELQGEGGDVLRPGMRGLAKIEIDERPLASIWTNDVLHWLRLKLWRWSP